MACRGLDALRGDLELEQVATIEGIPQKALACPGSFAYGLLGRRALWPSSGLLACWAASTFPSNGVKGAPTVAVLHLLRCRNLARGLQAPEAPQTFYEAVRPGHIGAAPHCGPSKLSACNIRAEGKPKLKAQLEPRPRPEPEPELESRGRCRTGEEGKLKLEISRSWSQRREAWLKAVADCT